MLGLPERSAGVAPEVNLRETVTLTHLPSVNKGEPSLAMKPRGDVTRSLKQGHQWPHKKDSCSSKIKKQKLKSQNWKDLAASKRKGHTANSNVRKGYIITFSKKCTYTLSDLLRLSLIFFAFAFNFAWCEWSLNLLSPSLALLRVEEIPRVKPSCIGCKGSKTSHMWPRVRVEPRL